MKTTSILATLGILLVAGLAQAAPKSILINKAPVRARIEGLLNKSKSNFKLTNELDAADISAKKGVSLTAAKKAAQGAYGMNNFNYGSKAKSYVVAFGARKLVMTRGQDKEWDLKDQPYQIQRFIARDAKSGLVVARGNLAQGKITWTRMKNEHSKNTPAERNAAE